MNFDIMMLPAVNATLNALSTVMLLCGFVMIKQKRIQTHRRFMIAALVLSILFLICYVLYHSLKGGVSTPFTGQGIVRPVYYTILITHVLLAAIVPVLAIITLRRGLAARYDKHRRIARWTFPIWLYVSVTGVLVYFMLYQWFPGR